MGAFFREELGHRASVCKLRRKVLIGSCRRILSRRLIELIFYFKMMILSTV